MATLAADKVFLANGPGSSVLEEPGLAAYLPRLAEELLGEGLLLLDNPAWWCGDPAHLDYVLENLDKLRITVLNSSSRRQVLLPETMDSRELTDLVKKIRNDACSFVAQAIIAQSTCPTWVKERVVPCPTTLRTYLFQEGEGYTVMPGGLCTVTTPDEGIRLRKDTWILASEPERREPLLVSPSDRGPDSSHDEHSREELPPKDQGTDRVQVAYSLRSTEDAAPGSTVMNLDPRGLRYSPDADVGGHLFVSYSHADRKWLERLKVHLKPLIRDGMKVWDDTLIRPGSDWRKEIATALDTARAAVVLVSADFLASDFIAETELPVLLQAAEERGTSIFPVIISHSRYADTKLSRFQSINDPKRPLARLDRTQRDEVFVKVGKAIEEVWQRKRFAQQALVLPPLPSTRLADPQPRFASDQVRVLSERLETAYGSLEDALAAGQDTQAIRLEILSLRRELRDGGQVRAGDFLGHGRYKLIEAIGRGGFGTIWRAIDRRRQQLVAIKVLHGQFTEDRAHRNRFLRGARQMGALRHPAIVSVLDENLDDDGYCWYAMEYLAGGDLHRAVLEGRVGSWENCLAIVLTVGDALAFAHEKGVVHRDIKPHNIVLDEAGRPKLTDFDLVLAADTTGGTRTGMLGTWIYAAPEIMTRPQDAGPQADVYSLAMTAIFALHRAELPLDIIRYTPEFISKLAVPPAIMQVLLKGSSWNCGERWASMRGFCAELERLLGLPGIAGVSRTDHG